MKGILYMNVKILEDQRLYDKGMFMISRNRMRKIEKLKNPSAARLSLGAGILLKIAMEKADCGNLTEQIKTRAHGKPYLSDTDFHFSLSHSGEYAICAYSNATVGIDLQKKKCSIPKYLDKILTDEESAFLASMDEEKKKEVFYRIWSRKESLIKWDGRGLRIPLQDVSVVEQGEFAEQILFEGQTVYFQEFNFLLPDYTISVCSSEPWIADNIAEVTPNFLTKY